MSEYHFLIASQIRRSVYRGTTKIEVSTNGTAKQQFELSFTMKLCAFYIQVEPSGSFRSHDMRVHLLDLRNWRHRVSSLQADLHAQYVARPLVGQLLDYDKMM